MGVKPGAIKLDRATLAKQIVGLHQMAAVAMKQPLIAIDEKEGAMLADGVIGVGEQYAVIINPKALAWFNLFAAACAVYGPKAFVLVMTAPKRPPAPQGDVLDLGGGPIVPPAPTAGKLKYQ